MENRRDSTIQNKTKKDFSSLMDAYNFFKLHSNEYAVNSNKIINKLNLASCTAEGIKILDFGGGDGQLLSDIYTRTKIKYFNPILYILEPVEEYVSAAKNKLTNVGYNNLIAINDLNQCEDNYFDLVLINHVLYYVENLEETILKIIAKLKKNGETWIILANENNTLVILWKTLFSKLSIPTRYFLASDLQEILKRNKINCEVSHEMCSTFSFFNTKENRYSLIQFIFGNYADQISDKIISEEISRYIKDNQLCLPLSDNIYTIIK